MPKFRYVGDKDGVTERGTMIAESKKEVVAKLKAQGYEGVRVRSSAATTGEMFRRFFNR